MTELLNVQFNFNHWAVNANTEGISNEESLVQPAPGGNCMNWIVGHIVSSRNLVFNALGEEPIWSKEMADRYGRGSAPIASAADAVPFDGMLKDYNASQEKLAAALSRLTPERMAEPAPFSPTNNAQETIGTLLAAIAFHEAYHVGQTGTTRRLLGRKGAIT